ncbi:MAG: cytochrome c-type biogenesis protein CcmH [Chloroflexi bacterium]|nr:cytochrome c-type biogenesis protein CcmH [Chloroflexota bacterium]
MRLILLSVLTGLLAAAFAACAKPEPTLEQRAQRMDKQIICPVCPGETLDQSSVQIAKDMRELIRERLAAEQSEDEIKQYFVDRYGTRILAEPPASGVSLAVWIIPPVVMLAGAAALYFVVREMRRRRQDQGIETAQASSDPTLKPYLEAVDEELRSGRTGSG